MISETKPVASLGALLLARKGAASPAMKSGSELLGSDDLSGEDDGMSHDFITEADYEPVALHGEPEIIRQQEALATRIVKISAFQSPKPDSPISANISAKAPIRKVAFTLRLEPERHLRLKLASTLEGISAQQLVTRALDRLLADMPQVETLAQHMKRN